MNVKKLSVVLIATLAAALMAFALSGCGGAKQSDEEQIKADVENKIGLTITPEEMKKSFAEDATLQQYAKMGFDIDAYAENMANLFKIDVKEIKIDGDKADVVLTLTTPTFGDETQAMIEAEVNKIDTSNIEKEEEVTKLYMDVLNKVMTSSDFPVDSGDFTVKYVKKGGSWQLEDPDAIEKQIEEVENELAQLS